MKKGIIVVLGVFLVVVVFLLVQKNNTTLDINSKLVQDLYASVNPSDDVSVLKDLYEKEISNSYIVASGITNVLKDKGNLETISKKDIEDSVHSIFGDIPYSHEDTYLLNEYGCGYTYDSKTEEYQLLSGCGGNNNEKFYRKIISAEKQKNEILIKEKVIYTVVDWDVDTTKVTIYNNVKKETILDYLEIPNEEEIRNIDIEDYLDRASIYIYKFKLKDGNYIFDSIRLSA